MNIFEASENGNLEKVKYYLEKGMDVNVKNKSGADWTPLLEACRYGHFNLAHFLLEQGADFNVQSNARFTPLMAASCCGSFEIVKLLLEHGANANVETITGSNALIYAGNKQNILLLFHQYSQFFKDDEKRFLQKRKYHCSFGLN